MSFGVRLKVWGDFACFTRPEMKVERVSYDVMTPSAARGILEAVYWKPGVRWVVDRIHVLNPIVFSNIRRNEVGGKVPMGIVQRAIRDGVTPVETFIEEERQQRAALVLKDVAYVIEAHFELANGQDDNTAKHREMFERRARKGQCFTQPYLGCREFPAAFAWAGDDDRASGPEGEKDLGWMLWDMDYENNMEARFFRARMVNGIIEIPVGNGKEVVA